jgi:hypothetical protein
MQFLRITDILAGLRGNGIIRSGQVHDPLLGRIADGGYSRRERCAGAQNEI